MAARPDLQVVMVGADGKGYGPAPADTTWKQLLLDEVGDRLDLKRLHFVGRVPTAIFWTCCA